MVQLLFALGGLGPEFLDSLRDVGVPAAAVVITSLLLWWTTKRSEATWPECAPPAIAVVGGVLLANLLSTQTEWWFAPVEVVVVTCVAKDVIGEVRFLRQHPQFVVLARFDDVTAASAALDAVEPHVDVFARGLHHRMLWRFFAPWVPVELLVDVDDEARAASLLANSDEGDGQ